MSDDDDEDRRRRGRDGDDQAVHRLLGLTDEEYDQILTTLGRDPRPAELAMYSVMWSEHCSYKSSRVHLRRLPTTAPWVVVGPGENAGVVDIGDGWLAALRIESHNHPSFVEPYQGAATGVGGILRDIFTMGARPIALWDSLRFGPLDQPRNRYLFKGVVAGIAGYGNAVGVPTVGGELGFAEHYSANPLVNVMCLGLLRPEQLVLATAGPEGTIAVLLGAATGRDGIGGASVLASASFADESASKRPSVQVGDPFEEKKLIEACLELYEQQTRGGDSGSRRGRVVVRRVRAGRPGRNGDGNRSRPGPCPRTRNDRTRTVDVGVAGADDGLRCTPIVSRRCSRWRIVGRSRRRSWAKSSTADRSGFFHGGELIAEVPAASLTDDAPRYERPLGEPGWMEDLWGNTVKFVAQPAIATSLLQMLAEPELGSKSWVYEQYDHMLFLNTVVGPGHDATLLRVKGTNRGLALTTDGNGLHVLPGSPPGGGPARVSRQPSTSRWSGPSLSQSSTTSTSATRRSRR